MKVLLLSPPFLPHYMRNARCDFVSLSATQWYPVWLGSCGALLEKHGHEVRLVDAPAAGLSGPATEEIFRRFGPDLLVVYTGRMSETSDLAFTERLLDIRDCRTILVGPFFSIDPARTLGASRRIFHGARGEFEYPVLEFLEGRPPAEIPGLVLKEQDRVRTIPPRPPLGTAELDRLPFVSDFFGRHLDLRHYRAPSEPFPFLDLLGGRGCRWGRCTFCLWVHSFLEGGTYRARSAANVVEELAWIERRLPRVRSVMFQDDTMPEDRAAELSEAMLRAGTRIRWSCYARAEIGPETLKAMKAANCLNLHVGFESGDDLILRSVRKGLTRERMTRFMADARKAGLRVHGDFAIGFPGETRESVRKTVAWALELRPFTAQFQLLIPYPGTPFHAELEQCGCLADGLPRYPGLTAREMERLAKKAYLRFYMSPSFLGRVIVHPRELLFGRIGTYREAIASLLWRRIRRGAGMDAVAARRGVRAPDQRYRR